MLDRATPDWRELLTALRVEWIDKGPNTKRGNINIKCPWCRDDPSYHLALSETKWAFYCYRNPEHRGSNLRKVLVALDVPFHETVNVLNKYVNTAPPKLVEKATANDVVRTRWATFAPASESQECIDYLAKRGFPNPVEVISRYDLRYAPAGEWARRLMIPISDTNGDILSWTGRDMRGNAMLRYKMIEVHDHGLIYTPRSMRSTLIIVEGPMDALKVSAATEDMPVSTVALLGLGINVGKILRTRKLIISSIVRNVFLALDQTVKYQTVSAISRQLALGNGLRYKPIRQLCIPSGFADPGEMQYDRIRTWVPPLS